MTERTLAYGVTDALLRRLAEWGEANAETTAVSLYLNLDPGEFSTADARQSAVSSVLSEARDLADEDSSPCVERIAERLADLDGLEGAEGVAVFCAAEPELFTVLALPGPVERHVSIGSLNLRPLLAAHRGDTWCVLHVNRSNARVFLGTEHRLTELAQVQDDVKNQHKKGGWSQARFERSVGQDVAEHVGKAGDEVFGFLMRTDFDHLLVGAPEGLRAEVESELHSYLTEKLRGWVEVDVDNTPSDDVVELVRPAMAAHRETVVRETVERFGALHGRGELSAAGLGPVLEALVAMRVDTLLVAEDAASPGVSCPACTYLAVEGDACPLDGSVLEAEADVVAKAVELAFLQSAGVVTLDAGDASLAEHDGAVAAVLRY